MTFRNIAWFGAAWACLNIGILGLFALMVHVAPSPLAVLVLLHGLAATLGAVIFCVTRVVKL